MSTSTPTEIKDDPRVQELARCVAFAIGSFANKPILDPSTNKMETWHGWFKRAIVNAGYVLTEPAEPKPAATEPVSPAASYCWGKPGTSRSFHIFHGTRSVCGSWLHSGADQVISETNVERRPGDCAKCVAKFNAHHQPPKGKVR